MIRMVVLRGSWSMRCELLSEAITAGFLRGKLIQLLINLGQEVVDVGTHEQDEIHYPDIATLVGAKVGSREVIAAF